MACWKVKLLEENIFLGLNMPIRIITLLCQRVNPHSSAVYCDPQVIENIFGASENVAEDPELPIRRRSQLLGVFVAPFGAFCISN